MTAPIDRCPTIGVRERAFATVTLPLEQTRSFTGGERRAPLNVTQSPANYGVVLAQPQSQDPVDPWANKFTTASMAWVGTVRPKGLVQADNNNSVVERLPKQGMWVISLPSAHAAQGYRQAQRIARANPTQSLMVVVSDEKTAAEIARNQNGDTAIAIHPTMAKTLPEIPDWEGPAAYFVDGDGQLRWAGEPTMFATDKAVELLKSSVREGNPLPSFSQAMVLFLEEAPLVFDPPPGVDEAESLPAWITANRDLLLRQPSIASTALLWAASRYSDEAANQPSKLLKLYDEVGRANRKLISDDPAFLLGSVVLAFDDCEFQLMASPESQPHQRDALRDLERRLMIAASSVRRHPGWASQLGFVVSESLDHITHRLHDGDPHWEMRKESARSLCAMLESHGVTSPWLSFQWYDLESEKLRSLPREQRAQQVAIVEKVGRLKLALNRSLALSTLNGWVWDLIGEDLKGPLHQDENGDPLLFELALLGARRMQEEFKKFGAGRQPVSNYIDTVALALHTAGRLRHPPNIALMKEGIALQQDLVDSGRARSTMEARLERMKAHPAAIEGK